MESFFDREVKRLEYVGERQQLRSQQKKEIDAALVAKEQVCVVYYIYGHSRSGLVQVVDQEKYC